MLRKSEGELYIADLPKMLILCSALHTHGPWTTRGQGGSRGAVKRAVVLKRRAREGPRRVQQQERSIPPSARLPSTCTIERCVPGSSHVARKLSARAARAEGPQWESKDQGPSSRKRNKGLNSGWRLRPKNPVSGRMQGQARLMGMARRLIFKAGVHQLSGRLPPSKRTQRQRRRALWRRSVSPTMYRYRATARLI